MDLLMLKGKKEEKRVDNTESSFVIMSFAWAVCGTFHLSSHS
jgi:hypothetical protein